MKILRRIGIALLTCAATLAASPGKPQAKGQPIGQELVYKSVGGLELKLYVVTPPDWSANDRRPAIVWFHGGGWTKGSPSQFNSQSRYLASRGMVCILAQYRLLSGKTETPAACIEDAKSAFRWVRGHASNLGIDPQRIAAGGGSAGGHLAAACAFLPDFNAADDQSIPAVPNALILLNPVFDNGPDGGYAQERVGDRYQEFSPAHNIKTPAPPSIILIGSVDNLIPLSTVQRFKERMVRAGARCDVVIYEGQGHAFFNQSNANGKYRYETLLEVDKFLSSIGYLSGPPTLKPKNPDGEEGGVD